MGFKKVTPILFFSKLQFRYFRKLFQSHSQLKIYEFYRICLLFYWRFVKAIFKIYYKINFEHFKHSKDERIADQYLAYLKWREFKNTVDLDFPPLKPIEKVLNRIVKSELYQALTDFPKGGILHSHEGIPFFKGGGGIRIFQFMRSIFPGVFSSGKMHCNSNINNAWTLDLLISIVLALSTAD